MTTRTSCSSLVGIHLTRQGYRVLEASNAAEALEMLEKEVPDLAVVDVMMPGMDGIELTRILSQDYGIPVILLTARGVGCRHGLF